MMEMYGSTPGCNPGPIDDSVLHDQDKHVSSAVWEGQERGALRCHEHTSKLDQWRLTPKQIELITNAGFGYLRLIPAISLDNPLISALVERWRRETNTFHFTVGEMTVTLEDVGFLLGLPIDGDPVIGVTYTSCEAVCMKYLGRAPDSGSTSGGMVKLSWLKETFFWCPEDAKFEDIERHTRAYLLYLVGSTIFSTTTGNKVPVMYLPLFENFILAGKYAWGAAALSFLYRALGNASLKSQSTISGCLTMLQCWSYYRLSVGRPKLKQEPKHDCFPFVLRWKGKQCGATNRDVAFYRKALDSLKPSDVEWCPYSNISLVAIPYDIRNNLILGRSNTMLICFDKAERHLPDRCLRQFGMQQPIPQDVQRWERKSRGVDGGVDLAGKMESELTEWVDRHLRVVDIDEDVDESEYMPWYLNITRKLVGRPVPITSEFQRMNVALRDIAHVVDMLSTQGMDDHQINAVARIRYLAHECLRDHGGSLIVEVANPQDDIVKRIRGKERVRRKSAGKRKRKEHLGLSHVETEGVRSGLCVVQMEADQSPLYHLNSELDHSQLCLPASEGEDAELCYLPNKVVETQGCLENQVDDSHFKHAVEAVDETQYAHMISVNTSVPSNADLAVVSQSSLESSKDVEHQNDYSVLV
ncbi:protein MAIN-LIKE 2 isoform X2 [Daucus carota subsp. sativus]|nr:PREDICTED: serine/threonine-protein phosphatase 7 long form homolog isoform X2 [Daucus carota subsp. sativus]XP_017258943.1 PREDICTED: serine/threonine-protein phosphatase 7 long form homolog isoform X2 [Daucus carota subsp. sativus]